MVKKIPSYSKLSTAKKCPVHLGAYQTALDMLSRRPAFKCDDVLKRANLTMMAGSLNWQFVRRMIEEHFNTKLIPLAAAYWEEHEVLDEYFTPNSFVAVNRWTPTAGFAMNKPETAHLFAATMRVRGEQTSGRIRAAERIVRESEEVGVVGMGQFLPWREKGGIENITNDKKHDEFYDRVFSNKAVADFMDNQKYKLIKTGKVDHAHPEEVTSEPTEEAKPAKSGRKSA